MLMTKEEREELVVMARMAKASGFQVIRCDVDVMLRLIDTIDALEEELRELQRESDKHCGGCYKSIGSGGIMYRGGFGVPNPFCSPECFKKWDRGR